MRPKISHFLVYEGELIRVGEEEEKRRRRGSQERNGSCMECYDFLWKLLGYGLLGFSLDFFVLDLAP